MFYELGGKLPEEMEIATEAFDEDTKAVGVRVVDEDDLYLRDYINAGIAELEKIAEVSGVTFERNFKLDNGETV